MNWLELWFGYLLFLVAAVTCRLAGNLLAYASFVDEHADKVSDHRSRLLDVVSQENESNARSFSVQVQFMVNSLYAAFTSTGVSLLAIGALTMAFTGATVAFNTYHPEVLDGVLSVYRSEAAQGLIASVKLVLNLLRFAYNCVVGVLLFLAHLTSRLKRVAQLTVAECAADGTKEVFVALVQPFVSTPLAFVDFLQNKGVEPFNFTQVRRASPPFNPLKEGSAPLQPP